MHTTHSITSPDATTDCRSCDGHQMESYPLALVASAVTRAEMRAEYEDRMSNARLEITKLRDALAVMSITIERVDMPIELGVPPTWRATLDETSVMVVINADHMVLEFAPEFLESDGQPFWDESTMDMIDGLTAEVDRRITRLTSRIESLRTRCADREAQPD